MESFPTSGWAIISVLIAGYTTIFAFMAKLIVAYRKREEAMTDKMVDQVIPALATSTATNNSAIEAMQKALQLLAVSEALQEEKRRR